MFPQSQQATRLNKISSTFSVIDSMGEKQTESLMSSRPSHRKYKLSHSQITKIDKLSKSGLLRWKQSRESQDNDNKHFSNNNNNVSDRVSEKCIKNNIRKDKQKHKTTEVNIMHPNDDNNDDQNEVSKNNRIKATQNNHQHLHQIQQATTSMHSINYQLKKDKMIRLQKDMTLHVQIITFDLGTNRNCGELIETSEKEGQTAGRQQQIIIEVICFQVHDKRINMHYRSQFTYKTLGKDVKFVFQSIEELFEFVTAIQHDNHSNYNSKSQEKQSLANNQSKSITFNRHSMQLELMIKFQSLQQGSSQNFNLFHSNHKKQRLKIINIPLLPFAIIEIVQHNHHEEEEKINLQQHINQLKHDLQVSRNLIHALREENDKLKAKAKKQKNDLEKQKAEKEIIIQNYQKLSRVSDITIKEYHFDFIPDPKAKNANYFQFKNNILKKIKNDIKWDQVSSQAPLPKAGRHYFSFLIKDFLPDFMFGIVTLKGKDTSNAFLGLQTICLYASKNNCYIYERGKHYKISVNVKRNDTVFVIVDRQKSVIEWVKRKGQQGSIGEKQKSHEGEQTQEMKNQSFISMAPFSAHTQDDLSSNFHHRQRQRKSSQSISSSQLLSNQLSAISILPLTTAVDYTPQEIDYIHSTIIPQEMLSRELFAYLEVYNVNEPLKLNEKK